MMIAKSFDMAAPSELDKHKDPAPLLRYTQDNSGGTGPGRSEEFSANEGLRSHRSCKWQDKERALAS